MISTLHLDEEEPQMSLAIPADMTFDIWSSLGRKLCMAGRTINWLVGDWLIAGSERYGEKARTEANAIFRADVDRFGPIVDTCRRFPEPARRTALTFGHHLAVMRIEDDAQAQAMLANAEAEHLTTAALKAQVRVVTNRQASMLDDDPEDAAYRVVIQASNRCGSTQARRMAVEAIVDADYGIVDL